MPAKFSGHETFPCRYAWLPKAYAAVDANGGVFGDEESAMITLGVGKNMTRSMRFWVQAAGIAEPGVSAALQVTPFGRAVLGRGGLDPFLEDVRTLWLVHWQLSASVEEPLFAWDFLLNRWHQPDLNRTAVLRAFRQEADRLDRPLSDVTLEQHFDAFLHSYVPTRSRKGDIQEDNLDCPLVELELIQQVGERRMDASGRREAIYAFRREEKPDITPELFVYCVEDFFRRRHPTEKTLSYRDLTVGHGSPGQVFKLPEGDVRERLASIDKDSRGLFRFEDSTARQLVARADDVAPPSLSTIYER